MDQDEANAMVLIILLGIIWSVIRNAIHEHSSKISNQGHSAAKDGVHRNQALAPSRTGSEVGRLAGVGGEPECVDRDIDLIRRIDPTFDVRQFLDSGCLVYEAIVLAFAKGDSDLLRDLTSEEVYEEFAQIIALREQRRERVELEFVCLRKARIDKVSFFNMQAQITFGFSAQLVTATRAENGAVIAGDPAKVSDVNDLWTFACELASKKPVWKLVATEAA